MVWIRINETRMETMETNNSIAPAPPWYFSWLEIELKLFGRLKYHCQAFLSSWRSLLYIAAVVGRRVYCLVYCRTKLHVHSSVNWTRSSPIYKQVHSVLRASEPHAFLTTPFLQNIGSWSSRITGRPSLPPLSLSLSLSPLTFPNALNVSTGC